MSGRTTPKGTPDPNRRKRIVGTASSDLESLNRAAAAAGMPPLKAAPRSGRCVACGRDLRADDRDHSVCNDCWPKDAPDLEVWRGRSVDYTRVDLETGRVEEVTLPVDPSPERAAFDPEADYAVILAWCQAEADIAEGRQQTHDALIGLLGPRRLGPVRWSWWAQSEAAEVLDELKVGAAPEVFDYYRRLGAMLREYGGWIVAAFAEGER